MEIKKRQALEAAGWRLGDASDFLEMTDVERQLFDARIEAALAVRGLRATLKLSQKQLASRIKTSQPRVAKIERAGSGCFSRPDPTRVHCDWRTNCGQPARPFQAENGQECREAPSAEIKIELISGDLPR